MTQSAATINHDVIRNWAESRKGHPAVVRATHPHGKSSDSKSRPGSAGILRIDFDPPQESLERIEWSEFFETFDARQLAFVYQEKTAAGRKSRFGKFVQRDSVEVDTGDSRSQDSKSKSASGAKGSRSKAQSEEEQDEDT